MKNKVVLVTGGAGFIGSNLVRHLIDDNNTVTVLDNFLSGFRDNLDPHPLLRIVDGDVRDIKAVELTMQGSEFVFHLAASVGNKRSIDLPLMDAEINVLGTLNILESARKYGIRKVIVSSSAGIFGELKTVPIKEDHPLEPDSPYGCTKLCEEKLSLTYSKLYDFEVICLRYFNVYGPKQRYDSYGNAIPIFVFRMLRNEPIIIFGDGEQTRDFVHVDDVIQANLNAADINGISGAFNIASGTQVTINTLVEIITASKNSTVKVEHGPVRLGDVRHSLADITLSQTKLNYFPKMDLVKGINGYVEWAQKFIGNHRNV